MATLTNNLINNNSNQVKYLLIPERGISLERETAYLRPVLSDGLKCGREEEYYYNWGDAKGAYVTTKDNYKEILESWRTLARYFKDPDAVPERQPKKKMHAAKPQCPENNFSKSGHELLRKILGE